MKTKSQSRVLWKWKNRGYKIISETNQCEKLHVELEKRERILLIDRHYRVSLQIRTNGIYDMTESGFDMLENQIVRQW